MLKTAYEAGVQKALEDLGMTKAANALDAAIIGGGLGAGTGALVGDDAAEGALRGLGIGAGIGAGTSIGGRSLARLLGGRSGRDTWKALMRAGMSKHYSGGNMDDAIARAAKALRPDEVNSVGRYILGGIGGGIGGGIAGGYAGDALTD